MKEDILSFIDSPTRLEQLYRKNKTAFKREFNLIYPSLSDNAVANCWKERLNYDSEDVNWGTKRELALLVVASLIAGCIAKLPAFFSIDEEFFYPRNIGFIILPLLSGYFAWRNKMPTAKIAVIAGAIVAGAVYINILPNNNQSDTLILSCVHLVLFLWSVLGFAFVGTARYDSEKRLGFLRYNGDLVVMTTLILIAGGIMTGITVGLFKLIGFNIENFYFQHIGIFGLSAAPIVGTYLTQTNPHLVGKVSPVIAKLFSPLVAVMLVVYLVAILYSHKNPYNDREFLLIFNALLIGVLAIIFFSAAENAKGAKSDLQIGVLFALSVLTIIVNGVALSAIVFRISEWGITPNRAAVLGGNILILINLLLVAVQLFKVLFKKSDTGAVGNIIAYYLPFYGAWTIVITFIFPLMFGFK